MTKLIVLIHILKYLFSKTGQEKLIRGVRIIDSDFDPESIYDEKDDDDDEEDLNLVFPDQSGLRFDTSLMAQAYRLLEEAGSTGLTQNGMGKKLGKIFEFKFKFVTWKIFHFSGLNKLDARTICRNLERRQLVTTISVDQGKQRVVTFVAKKFQHSDQAQFKVEQERKLKLTNENQTEETNNVRKDVWKDDEGKVEVRRCC